MCNSPATFQSMMDNIFADLKEKGYCIVYMDNILIYASSREHLEKATREVLEILRKNDLFLKPEKCEFYKKKVAFLGMLIEHSKMRSLLSSTDSYRNPAESGHSGGINFG